MRVVVAANIILKVEQSHATIDTHTHTHRHRNTQTWGVEEVRRHQHINNDIPIAICLASRNIHIIHIYVKYVQDLRLKCCCCFINGVGDFFYIRASSQHKQCSNNQHIECFKSVIFIDPMKWTHSFIHSFIDPFIIFVECRCIVIYLYCHYWIKLTMCVCVCVFSRSTFKANQVI